MEKEHFEILLEHIESNSQLALESISGVNNRLDRLETGQNEIKLEVREMRKAFGLIHTIASDHETRLQDLENRLDDHINSHSTDN